MVDDASDSITPFTGVGVTALTAGVICCVGLKVLGAAALFGGLAAAIGFSVDVVTFLAGGLAGLVLGIVWVVRLDGELVGGF